jgi:large subunit ribosomal protein L35
VYKLKTKGGAKKRFKVNKAGKVKFRHAYKRHNFTFAKTQKQKSQLRGTGFLKEMDAKKVKEVMPYDR